MMQASATAARHDHDKTCWRGLSCRAPVSVHLCGRTDETPHDISIQSWLCTRRRDPPSDFAQEPYLGSAKIQIKRIASCACTPSCQVQVPQTMLERPCNASVDAPRQGHGTSLTSIRRSGDAGQGEAVRDGGIGRGTGRGWRRRRVRVAGLGAGVERSLARMRESGSPISDTQCCNQGKCSASPAAPAAAADGEPGMGEPSRRQRLHRTRSVALAVERPPGRSNSKCLHSGDVRIAVVIGGPRAPSASMLGAHATRALVAVGGAGGAVPLPTLMRLRKHGDQGGQLT